MMLKTHLVISIFFVLLLIPFVEYKWAFVVVAIIATYLPDIDSRYSRIGHRKIARILQWFTKHRGLFHSFSFLLIVTFFLAFFVPVIALGFFLGYGLHLFADSFTVEGIRPFYPSKNKSKGNLKTGSRMEIALFVVFLIADIGLLFNRMAILF